MIVVELSGNIGEQLFQYAAARNFSLIYNSDLLLDCTWFNKTRKNKLNPNKVSLDGFNTVFGLAGSVIINNFLRKKEPFYISRYPHTVNYKVIRENKKLLAKEFYDTNPPFYMTGDFRSEIYFEENIEQLKDDLTVNLRGIKKIEIIAEKIVKKNVVGIYINRKFVNKNHNTILLDIDYNYYQNAINHFENEKINLEFIVFYDENLEDVQKLKINYSIEYFKLYEDENEWKNIYLMSKCKYFIADDSATSWWAAWLNFDKDRKVIIPQNFSFDIPEITHSKLGIQQNWMKV